MTDDDIAQIFCLSKEREGGPFRTSDMLHKFWIEEGESGKLVLIEVHHEELVRGRQLGLLGGELAVEVGDVFPVALQKRGTRYYDARSSFTRSLLYLSNGPSLLHDVSLVSKGEMKIARPTLPILTVNAFASFMIS